MSDTLNSAIISNTINPDIYDQALAVDFVKNELWQYINDLCDEIHPRFI